MPVISALGRQRQDNLWGSLVSQPNLFSELLQGSDPVSKAKCGLRRWLSGYKHEDTSSDPQHSCEKLDVLANV